MIYLLTFLISVILFYKGSQRKSKYLCCLAILIPCILAGLRDLSIGIDVTWYVSPGFDAANGKPLAKFLSGYEEGEIEKGYLVFVWMITNIFHNLGVLLFSLEFIILLPFYLFFYNNKNHTRAAIYLLIYLFSFYNMQLCVIRQSMAVSLVFTAFFFYMRRRYFIALLFALWGVLTHNSALLLFLTGMILIVLEWKMTPKKIVLFTMLSGVMMLFAVSYIYNHLELIAGNAKYVERLDNSLNDAEGGGLITNSVFALAALIPLAAYFYNHIKYAFFGVLPLVGAILQFAFQGTYFSRLAYLFLPLLPLALYYSTYFKRKFPLMDISLLMIFFVYWFVSFIIRNNWETYPYIFR